MSLHKILHWTPRILGILAILFISMFALDAFHPDLTLWQQLGNFLMHMIPSFILIALLLIAWKWELTGGIIFTLLGLIFTPIVYNHNFKMNHSVGMSLTVVLMITVPFLVVGLLFLASHFIKRKAERS